MNCWKSVYVVIFGIRFKISQRCCIFLLGHCSSAVNYFHLLVSRNTVVGRKQINWFLFDLKYVKLLLSSALRSATTGPYFTVFKAMHLKSLGNVSSHFFQAEVSTPLLSEDLMRSDVFWTKVSLPAFFEGSHKEVRRAACGLQVDGCRHLAYALVMVPCSLPFRLVCDVFRPCPIRLELQVSKFLAIFCGRWNSITGGQFVFLCWLWTQWIAVVVHFWFSFSAFLHLSSASIK
jgi:hypothetical protein